MRRNGFALALGLVLLAPGVAFARPSRHSSALRGDWHAHGSRFTGVSSRQGCEGGETRSKARRAPRPEGRAKGIRSGSTCKP